MSKQVYFLFGFCYNIHIYPEKKGVFIMTLTEQAKKYYTDEGKNCAVAILLAGSDVYGLGLGTEDTKLVVGFGGGMGCGNTCGALAGSISVLGKLFVGREDFRAICAEFVKAFEDTLGCNSTNCSVLCPKYKTEERRCEETVLRTADLLEKFVGEKNG